MRLFNVHICGQIIDFIAGMQPLHPPTRPILQVTEDGFHLLMSSPTWSVYFDILFWWWWRAEFERIDLNKDSFLQPPANSVYMTDAPPPYPGINGNNGYRLETRPEFAMLKKKKSHLTQFMYIAQLLFQGINIPLFKQWSCWIWRSWWVDCTSGKCEISCLS